MPLGELAQEVSPGTNVGSTNISVETGSNDFGEKIAQIFSEIIASPVANEKNTATGEESVLHGCEECEYRSMHVHNLQRHMENMHKSVPHKRKQKEGQNKKGERRTKRKKMEDKKGNGNEEGWKVVKRERILELAPISSDYIQSLTLPPLLPEQI